MKKSIFVICMCFILCICPSYDAYADAGSIAIAGGSFATGGLAVGGLSAFAGPAVVIVFATLMACGMDIELTQQSQNAGMTKSQFLRSKINQYCSEANITIGTFTEYILSETTIATNGAIRLGDKARTQIIQFGNWLFDNNMVFDNTNAGDAQAVQIGDNLIPIVSAGRSGSITITPNIPVAWAILSANSTNYITIMFSNTSFTYRRSDRAYTYDANSLNGYYYTSLQFTKSYYNENQSLFQGIPILSYSSAPGFIESLDGRFTVVNPTGSNTDTMTGKETDWTQNKDRLNTGVINPGITNGLDIPQDKDYTINIREYLDAIQRVLDKLQDLSIPATDDETGMPVDLPIDDSETQDPAIDNENPHLYKTPVVDPNLPVKNPTASTEPLKFDLTNIFPFCIPFDIKDMISLLSAEPQAPNYTVSWDIPFINQTLTFTVDLSAWDSVALILRRMELLAFIIGLAFVTRNIIRG